MTLRSILFLLTLMVITPMARAQSPNFDRLERLAADLEGRVQRLYEVRPHCFNMDFWTNGDDPSSDKFVGCAAAHGTYLLAGEGFRLEKLAPTIDGKEKYVVVSGGLYGVHATMKFFSLDYTTACRLFGYSRDTRPSPREVAARIREVCRVERARRVAIRVGVGVEVAMLSLTSLMNNY
jgi:hypothetical protein